MTKRTKKPAVRPEIARQWLRRYEEDGESPPQIAKADGYDVRTVRKYLELMRQEREVREAKQVVLRQALEKHYVDICSFAEKLRADLSGDIPGIVSVILKDDPMWMALRSHAPRTYLWKGIEKWEALAKEFELLLEELKDRIRQEVRSSTSLEFTSSPDRVGFMEGFTDAIAFHVRSVALGRQGFEKAKYTTRKMEYGVSVELGPYTIGIVPEDRVERTQEICSALMDEAVHWEHYSALSKCTREFMDLQKNMREDLTRIILRRVLPGRCTYCPF